MFTRAQSIARHFNFRTSDKASFQVRVTSEAVFFDPISSCKCLRNEVVPGLGENLSSLWRYKMGTDIAETSHYQQWQEAAESE